MSLNETKIKDTGECEFGVVSGSRRGDVVIILSDRLASNVAEWKEVSSRLM